MAVLEGFETISGGLPSGLSWTGGPYDTAELSASHVTQGSFSFRAVVDANSGAAQDTPYDNDLTGAMEVSVDVYIEDISATGVAYLQVDNLFDELTADSSTEGQTGVVTLTADISAFANKGACRLYIGIFDNGAGGERAEWFWDNLRDDTGGAASVGSGLTTGLKLQRISRV